MTSYLEIRSVSPNLPSVNVMPLIRFSMAKSVDQEDSGVDVEDVRCERCRT